MRARSASESLKRETVMRRLLVRAAEAASRAPLAAVRGCADSSPLLSRAAEACCSLTSSSSSFVHDGGSRRWTGSPSRARQAIGVGAEGARRRRVHVDAAQSGLNDVGVVDPFSLVSDELSGVSERMRRAVVSEVPTLATAANYFFREGALGKRLRPTVILLIASALSEAGRTPPSLCSVDDSLPRETPVDVRRRQQRVAEVAELIHVASLLHDDVLDNATTRRGLRALNIEVGNKLAILAGDFLLARASVTLAALRDTEVIMLLSSVLEHLVTGEVMQMTEKPEDLLNFDHYLQKTHFKTASLLANSARAVAILGGGRQEVFQQAYDYGQHLGLAFQLIDDVLDFTGSAKTLGKPALNDLSSGLATAPTLYAAEQFPALRPLIQRKFKGEGDVDQARRFVESSDGVMRTRALAASHAGKAIACIEAFPQSTCVHARRARKALIELAQRSLERTK